MLPTLDKLLDHPRFKTFVAMSAMAGATECLIVPLRNDLRTISISPISPILVDCCCSHCNDIKAPLFLRADGTIDDIKKRVTPKPMYVYYDYETGSLCL